MDMTGLVEQLKKQKQEVLTQKSYRILQDLFDKDSFTPIDTGICDSLNCAEVMCGFGAINGRPAYAFCQGFDECEGVISNQHIKKLKRLYALASKARVPIVGIYASSGMKLDNGEDLLVGMGELISSSLKLSTEVPQISVVLGPCLGLNCVLARSADILIATESSDISVNIKEDGTSSLENDKNSIVDMLVQDSDSAFSSVRNLISMLPSNSSSPAPKGTFKEPVNSSFDGFELVINSIYNNNAYDVKTDIIEVIFDDKSFAELSHSCGQAFCVGIAKIGGVTVCVVALTSGAVSKLIDKEDVAKVQRFISFCDRFNIPVISFFDSKEFASSQCAIDFYKAYNLSKVQKFNVILGELYGSLASVVLSDDINCSTTLAWPCAKISLLPYKAMATISYNDDLKKSEDPIKDRKIYMAKFQQESASPLIASKNGIISDVIDPLDTRKELFSLLELFCSKNVLSTFK